MVHIAGISLATTTVLAFFSGKANASPMLETRAGVTALTATQISAYQPAELLARAAYCPASTTATWSCGAFCTAIAGFVPYGAGGDGGSTPYWYVGYDKTLTQSVVVGHQGTDPSKLSSDLVDADFFLDEFDSTLFPGFSTDIKAHNGFLESHARSASGILAAVKAAMTATGSKKVTIVGHSLGGALALLDAVYLPLHLASGTTFTTTTFGLPRVGNPAFADYVDAHVTNFAHINNLKDIVPIVPGRGLGFAHPNGEKHILGAGNWVACSGHDNTDASCSTGAVANILSGSVSDHGGPYEGIEIGGC